MPVYIIDTTFGLTVEEYKDKATAVREAKKAHGTNNFKSLRCATLADLRWVKSMGGWLPMSARARLEDSEEKTNETK